MPTVRGMTPDAIKAYVESRLRQVTFPTSSSPVESTVVKYNEEGFFSVKTPKINTHPTTKEYVDALKKTLSRVDHVHNSLDITDTSISPKASVIPIFSATGELQSNDPTNEKSVVNLKTLNARLANTASSLSGNSSVSPESIVKRTNSGSILVPTIPFNNEEATSKQYVDDKISKKVSYSEVSNRNDPDSIVRRDSSGNISVNISSGERSNEVLSRSKADSLYIGKEDKAMREGGVVTYSSGNNIRVSITPSSDSSAASRKYVDDSIKKINIYEDPLLKTLSVSTEPTRDSHATSKTYVDKTITEQIKKQVLDPSSDLVWSHRLVKRNSSGFFRVKYHKESLESPDGDEYPVPMRYLTENYLKFEIIPSGRPSPSKYKNNVLYIWLS